MTEPNHDPLCPQQPRADGATLEMRNGKVVYCGCDLIAEVIAAAVQRVEALANEMRNWSSAETTAATEAVPDLTVDQWLWVQRGVLRSIAAIKGDQP